MSKTSSAGRLAIAALLALLPQLCGGCAGPIKNMRAVPASEAAPTPAAGKALVVFLRPSKVGSMFQSSVFHMKGESPELVGIVASMAKVAYQAEPGEHLFMVVGQSADFMSADLQAGKTYYALVTPRMGVIEARYSLKPVRATELGPTEFEKWLAECRWVALTPESSQWAGENQVDIVSKHDKYYPEWMTKSEADRPALAAADGR
jgi:hypothetical protein